MYNICFITAYMADENTDIKTNLRGRIPTGTTLQNKFGNYDFVLFTNLKNFKLDNWTTIILNNDFLDKQIDYKNENINVNVYRSRYPKFMGWKYFKEHTNKKYDIIFYCDISIKLDENVNWQEYSNLIINNEFQMMQMKHPRNNTAFKDCYDIEKLKIDSMTKTINYLNINNMDIDYIITQNNIFGYNPNDETILNVMNTFWNTYINEKLSHRDQPLWAYVNWKLNTKPIINNSLYYNWKKQSKIII